MWVHTRCSGITKRLVADPSYVCRCCNCEARLIVDVDGTMLDVEVLYGLGKVKEIHACPHHQTPSPRICDKVYGPVFARLYSTVVKLGDQITMNCSGSAAMTVPWSAGSLAPKTETTQPNFSTTETWQWGYCQSFTVGDSDGMAMYSGPRPI